MDIERLKRINLFADVSDDDLGQIAPFAQEQSVGEGRTLVKEGEFSYKFFGIEEGTAKVERGDEHLADLQPGDFFGEVGLVEKELRNATVTATSPMMLVTLDQWDLKRLEKAIPSVGERIRAVIQQRRPS
jgi:CRP-like cAMP-binding protein